MVKRLRLVLLPLVVVCFLLVGCFTVLGQTTEPKLISMSGSGWSLTVDKQPLSVDVKSVASVSVAKNMQQAQELSLVLNSLDECKSGVVEFKVDTVGLSCYKQLPLTEQEVKEGAVRPENVVNSYACFDSSGKKVLHIYASKLIDAKGDSVWVDQNLTKGVLTVYLNETWLEGAVFPVVLDPTFGRTDIGASWEELGQTFANNYTITVNGTLNNMTVYMKATSPKNAQFGFYTQYAGQPNILVTSGNVSVSSATGEWYTVSFDTHILNATYWFAVAADTGVYVAEDFNEAYTRCDEWGGPKLLTPFSVDNSYTERLSIYVDVTEDAAPTASPTPTATPTSSSVLDMNWLVFAFVVFGAVLCIIPARIFVVRVVVGLFGIVLAVTQLQNTALWFYPWSLVLWLFMSVCVLYSVWARTD